VLGTKVLIMGITFKENIRDIRNSRVIDIYRELKDHGIEPFVYDPYAEALEVEREYGISLLKDPREQAPYDAVVVAVKHEPFRSLTPEFFKSISNSRPIVVDVKGIYDKEAFKDLVLWRL